MRLVLFAISLTQALAATTLQLQCDDAKFLYQHHHTSDTSGCDSESHAVSSPRDALESMRLSRYESLRANSDLVLRVWQSSIHKDTDPQTLHNRIRKASAGILQDETHAVLNDWWFHTNGTSFVEVQAFRPETFANGTWEHLEYLATEVGFGTICGHMGVGGFADCADDNTYRMSMSKTATETALWTKHPAKSDGTTLSFEDLLKYYAWFPMFHQTAQ